MLPLGVELDKFSSTPPLQEHEGPVRILLPAFISPIKGIDVAIDAMRLLDLKGENMTLDIVGASVSGYEQYEADLRRKAAKLNNVIVRWRGWQDDIPGLMRWSDMVILPTRKDSLGRCLVEAMASARPVVACDAGGVYTVVIDGVTGYLIPQNDPQTLAEKISLLAGDLDLRRSIGISGREFVQSRHDIQEHVRRLSNFLREAMP